MQINFFTSLYCDWSIIEQINILYAEIFIIFELWFDNITIIYWKPTII